MPQSHISKIENGTIDLQTTSLLEIARALDLELMLVPRGFVRTFESFLSGKDLIQRPKYRLDESEDE